MLEFGTDKPDLRNPLRIIDLTEFFGKCSFKPFHGKTVRAIKVHAEMSKGFHEKMLQFALSIGMGGLGYLEVGGDLSYKGPIDKFIPPGRKASLRAGRPLDRRRDFLIADIEPLPKNTRPVRTELETGLPVAKNAYRFCFINDFQCTN